MFDYRRCFFAFFSVYLKKKIKKIYVKTTISGIFFSKNFYMLHKCYKC